MSRNNQGTGRKIKSHSENVARFQEKFLRGTRASEKAFQKIREPHRNNQGVIEKLRIRAEQTGKTIWRWGVGNPAEERDRISYKVRNGKLTITDDNGNIIKESTEKGIEKYNGITLHGKANRKGEIVLKENWWSQRKLEQGNAYLTPYERKEQAKAQDAWFISKITSPFRKKNRKK